MSRVKHDIRLDFSAVNLASLQTDADFRRTAHRLLPGALEELGQAMAEAAWARLHARAALRLAPSDEERLKFVAEASRRYKRHAPAADRQALEDVIIRRLKEAKASAPTKDGGTTVAHPSPSPRRRRRDS